MRRRLAVALSALALGTGMLNPVASEAAPSHDPVIFVHGWSGDSWNWDYFVGRFQADGYTQLYAWDYDHRQSNKTTAAQLSTYVDQVLAETGATKVDIVTHSMGGLNSRWYLKSLGGTAKVDDWVSIGGPNHGTSSAWGCWDVSCVEMRGGSTFLKTLNAGDETPGAVSYFTFWSPCDAVINPDTSTILSGATNTKTACIGHLGLIYDSAVYAGVRDSIA